MHRRARHLNPGSAGAIMALDSRFIAGLSDGDPVSTWNDRSGNGNNATGSDTSRPTYETNEQGGNPIIRFDGVNDLLNVAMILSQPLSVIVLWKEHTDIQYDLPFYSTSVAGGVVLGSVNNIATLYAGINLTGGTVTFNTYNIMTGVVNSTLSNNCLNGVQVASGNAGAQSINQIKLAYNFAGSHFFDNIAVVIVLPIALNTPLRRRLEHSAAFAFKIPCS